MANNSKFEISALDATTKFVQDALEMGKVAEYATAEFGSVKKSNRNYKMVLRSTITKLCMAQHTALAGHFRLINVPAVAMDGTPLSIEERTQALLNALGNDLPMATQSSLKNGGVYAIDRAEADVWMSKFDPKAGREFCVYGSLEFSDVISAPVEFPEMVIVDAGTIDGNLPLPMDIKPDDWAGKSMQFRGHTLTADNYPINQQKGTTQFYEGVKLAQLNTNVVKMMGIGLSKLGTTIKAQMAPTAVDARVSKVWASAEPVLLLRDDPIVRRILTGKTFKAVKELISLISEEKRGELSSRLNFISLTEDGKLATEARALGNLLNSKVPWGSEIETRCSRFMLGYVTDKVIPSGGIPMTESLLVMSDEHGADAIELPKNPGKEFFGQVAAIGWGLPCHGVENIQFFKTVPFKKGIGCVIKSSVAKAMDRDGDGDRMRWTTDKSIIALFAVYLNRELTANFKPTKTRIQADLSWETCLEYIIQGWEDNYLVGSLTTAAWKTAQIGDWKASSRFAWLAKMAPMLSKWDIKLDGRDMRTVARQEMNAWRDQLKAIKLSWKEMQNLADTWNSPRLMAGKYISEVACVVDACWNAGVKAVDEWDAANKFQNISMVKVRRLVFESNVTVTSTDWAAAREIVRTWGEYWGGVMKAGGSKPGQTHPIFKIVRQWAVDATPGACAALLQWIPQSRDTQNDGFALKFHSVFAAGRGTEIIGLHDAVKAKLASKQRKHEIDVLEAIAQVVAILK